MTTASATQAVAAPTVEQLLQALEQHFGKPAGEWTQESRDIATWICRHWTDATVRKIGAVLSCGVATINRADERIAAVMRRPGDPLRAAVRHAEDFLAVEAFPLEDEEPDGDTALAGWALIQQKGAGPLDRGDVEWATVTAARQVAMHTARDLAVESLPEIGAAIGGRNRTTVALAARRVDEASRA